MSDYPIITSFVMRCSQVEKKDEANPIRWKIKITHVQNDEEVTVYDLKEAFTYIKGILEE